jgi:hypothetical protein
MIYPLAEISKNRLMSSILEFWKIYLVKVKNKIRNCDWIMDNVIIFARKYMQLQTVLCYSYTYDMNFII